MPMSKEELAAFRQENLEFTLKDEGFSLLNMEGKILYLKCPAGHSFSCSYSNLFAKHHGGCPTCRRGEINTPYSIYYARFDLSDHSLWKIGITQHGDPRMRLRWVESSLTHSMTVLDARRFTYDAAKRTETLVLRKFREFRYKGCELSQGNSEAFTIDVLQGLRFDDFASEAELAEGIKAICHRALSA